MEFKVGQVLKVVQDCICAFVRYHEGDKWRISYISDDKRTYYLQGNGNCWGIYHTDIERYFTDDSISSRHHPRIATKFLEGLQI